jgi:Icc-related predicted phosphoesterase
MRLRILSDIHAEFRIPWHWPEDRDNYDVIVAAGDIAGSCASAVAELAGLGPAVFVPGNHEHYHHVLQDNIEAGREVARDTDVHFLARAATVIDGVRFIGATLWTDYALYRTTKPSMIVAGQNLNDHRLARYRESSGHIARFMPWHARSEHLADLKFISAALAEPFNGPTVVVTHHLPSAKSIAAKFSGDALNPAFASDLDHMILERQPALWIHGHTHDVCDYRLGATRVVCNPKGYGDENRAFDPYLTIEI